MTYVSVENFASQEFDDSNKALHHREKLSIAHDASILLIDDDEDQLLIYEAFLVAHGFRVKIAESAEAGLRLMSHYYFDVVVCDLRMPDMNGFDFIQAVRAITPIMPRSAHIPVIMLTACSGDLAEAAHRVGADLFCSKKVAKEQLVKQIWSLLKH